MFVFWHIFKMTIIIQSRVYHLKRLRWKEKHKCPLIQHIINQTTCMCSFTMSTHVYSFLSESCLQIVTTMTSSEAILYDELLVLSLHIKSVLYIFHTFSQKIHIYIYECIWMNIYILYILTTFLFLKRFIVNIIRGANNFSYKRTNKQELNFARLIYKMCICQ